MDDEQLAHLTQLHCVHWPATSIADAQAAQQALQTARLPPRLAAVLWLTRCHGATDPAFLRSWEQMVEAGVPAERLEQLDAWLTAEPVLTTASPRNFAASITALHVLLDGDWCAAAAAAVKHPRLLQLANPYKPDSSAELLAACQQLVRVGLGLEMRLALVRAALPKLPNHNWHRVHWHRVIASLDTLTTLLGSWQAAGEAALTNSNPYGSLLHLPDSDLTRHMAARLSAAGLDRSQLQALAERCLVSSQLTERLAALADVLHGGDLRAAAQDWLQQPAVLQSDRLWWTLRRLEDMGLQVANERGRERVMLYVTGDPAGAQPGGRITVPAGTPATFSAAAGGCDGGTGGRRVQSCGRPG